MSSPAIDGSNYANAATHTMALPITTAFAETLLDAGFYWVVSTTDGYLKQGKTGMTVAVVPTPRAPGAAMPAKNATTRLVAGVPAPLTIPVGEADATYISGIATSIAGTIDIVGPILR